MTTNTKILVGSAIVLILFFGGYAVGYNKFKSRGSDQTPDYKSLLKDTANYIGNLEEKQQSLQQRVKTASPDNSKVNSTIKNLKAKTESLEKENEKLRKAMSGMPALRESAARSENLKMQNQKLAADAQAANKAKLAYEKQKATLRSDAEKYAQLKTEKQQIEKQLKDSRKYAADIEKKMTATETALKQQQKMAAQNKNIQSQWQTCMSTNNQLEKKMANLEAAAGKNKDLAANNRQLEDKVKALDREIKEMRIRFNEIQNLVSESKKKR